MGTLVGPLLGVGIIKYFENIFSALNESALYEAFSFLPEFLQNIMVVISNPFVGEGWHLTLGALFMVVVIFLPGGVMEGLSKISKLFRKEKHSDDVMSEDVVSESTAKAEGEK